MAMRADRLSFRSDAFSMCAHRVWSPAKRQPPNNITGGRANFIALTSSAFFSGAGITSSIISGARDAAGQFVEKVQQASDGAGLTAIPGSSGTGEPGKPLPIRSKNRESVCKFNCLSDHQLRLIRNERLTLHRVIDNHVRPSGSALKNNSRPLFVHQARMLLLSDLPLPPGPENGQHRSAKSPSGMTGTQPNRGRLAK